MLILFIIGFPIIFIFIFNYVENNRLENEKLIERAIEADDKETFDYIVRTDQGDFYAGGEFHYLNSVTSKYALGEWGYIREIHKKKKDDNWVITNANRYFGDKITFYENEYNGDLFTPYHTEVKTHRISSKREVDVYLTPVTFTGSFIATTRESKLAPLETKKWKFNKRKDTIIIKNCRSEKLLENIFSSGKKNRKILIITFSIIEAGLIIAKIFFT